VLSRSSVGVTHLIDEVLRSSISPALLTRHKLLDGELSESLRKVVRCEVVVLDLRRVER
jgi:hypothetical protein